MIIDFENHYYSQGLLDRMATRTEYPKYDPQSGVLSNDSKNSFPFRDILHKLLDLTEQRLHLMDKNGIDMAILSGSIGAEQLEPDCGYLAAQEMNDTVYQAIQRHPDRFNAYAVIAVNNVEEAIKELTRCKKELGFWGWNAFSNYGDKQLDDEQFLPLLERAEELDMPIYLHPAAPNIPQLQGRGGILATKGVGFGLDVTIALFRLMFSGAFDRFPNLKVILGHLGEGIPFTLDRVNEAYLRFPFSPEHSPEYYFQNNIWVTTSGNFSAPALRCTLDVLGPDRILFGTDYPYEDMTASVEFIRQNSPNSELAQKIFQGNAAALGF